MADKVDRRTVMTKRILKEALIELMCTKSIHNISVKKLCETADVNRSTFYNHYDTPYDLYDDIINDISIAIGEIIENSKSEKDTTLSVLTAMLKYVENNREMFLVLLSDKSNLSLGQAFTRLVSRFIDNENNSELLMYCTQFIAAGMVNIIWIWLNKEDRDTPERVAMAINIMLTHGFKKASAFSGNMNRSDD